MWTEDKPVFHGRYYRIDGPINEPKGVQKPHPAFWIGGGGEKVTLKLVAKFGDATNLGNADLDQSPQARGPEAALRRSRSRLQRDCALDRRHGAPDPERTRCGEGDSEGAGESKL